MFVVLKAVNNCIKTLQHCLKSNKFPQKLLTGWFVDFSTQDIVSGKTLLLSFLNENSQCTEENKKKNPFSIVEYGER